MEYRSFGSLDWTSSALGFGCMRFPTGNGDSGAIQEGRAADMLHYAIDHGVNYLDTAYPYHQGESEPFLGRTLQGRYREKVRLATKLPCWKVEKKSDFDPLLGEQLDRLQTERLDFYLLHALNEKSWKKMEGLGVLSWLEKAQSDGRIGWIGFSFHDAYPVFKNIVDAYQGWDFCQIQYNYMDIDYQAGRKGLHYASDRGLGVVIMEPLRGGRLVNPPREVEKIWQNSSRRLSPAAWGLHWLWDQPQVSLVLSGMSEMSHVRENVQAAASSEIGKLNPDDQQVIQKVRETYRSLATIPCTGCEYCLPCPEGLNIPKILEIYNDALMYDKLDYGKGQYLRIIPEGERAEDCQACGECEENCPQGIRISDWMTRISKEYSA